MNCLTPLIPVRIHAICQTELCENDHKEIFWCRSCRRYFCAVHKDHNCRQEKLFEAPQLSKQENLPAVADRFCKCCGNEIVPHDFESRLVAITLPDGSKFSFYRCGNCETKIQKTRSQSVVLRQKERQKGRKAS